MHVTLEYLKQLGTNSVFQEGRRCRLKTPATRFAEVPLTTICLTAGSHYVTSATERTKGATCKAFLSELSLQLRRSNGSALRLGLTLEFREQLLALYRCCLLYTSFELFKTGQKIENRLAIIDVSRQNAIENRLMRGRIESDGQTDLVFELSLLAFPNSSFL